MQKQNHYYFEVDGQPVAFTSLLSYLEELPNFSKQEADFLYILAANDEPMTAREVHLQLTRDFPEYKNLITSSVGRSARNLKLKGSVLIDHVGECTVTGKTAQKLRLPISRDGLPVIEAKLSDESDESDDDGQYQADGLDHKAARTRAFEELSFLDFDYIEKEARREYRMRLNVYKDKRIVKEGKDDKYQMTQETYDKRLGAIEFLGKLAKAGKRAGVSPQRLLQMIAALPPVEGVQTDLFD